MICISNKFKLLKLNIKLNIYNTMFSCDLIYTMFVCIYIYESCKIFYNAASIYYFALLLHLHYFMQTNQNIFEKIFLHFTF